MTFHIFLFLFCRRKKNLARRRRRRRRVRRETPSESQQGSVLPLSLSFFRAAPRSKERGGGGRRGKGARKSETDNGEEERVKEAPSPLHAVAGPDRTEPNRTERLVCLSTSVCLFPPRSPYLYVCGREREREVCLCFPLPLAGGCGEWSIRTEEGCWSARSSLRRSVDHTRTGASGPLAAQDTPPPPPPRDFRREREGERPPFCHLRVKSCFPLSPCWCSSD